MVNWSSHHCFCRWLQPYSSQLQIIAARNKDGYSHARHAISELGEHGLALSFAGRVRGLIQRVAEGCLCTGSRAAIWPQSV